MKFDPITFRDDMTRAIRRRVSDHVYTAGVHSSISSSGHVSVLTGSRDLASPCLRLLRLTDNGQLEARAELVRPGSSVRCSVLLEAGDSEVRWPRIFPDRSHDLNNGL